MDGGGWLGRCKIVAATDGLKGAVRHGIVNSKPSVIRWGRVEHGSS